ncbi:hypothetical protein Ga0466249_002285 [Sporomusaceae bacterium BoRhaA]|uniref:phage portal protein family protein n=1 Tax=Pelorhabdus rhamnosifermentans TaxID=2772457 RepID=UPI001C0625CA|nr:hypothetical protein [Pelorhabdus rhamnosifermentans]MBU2701171.1 hypothetical protein [Pelorhabdus rhamnosifermentans]
MAETDTEVNRPVTPMAEVGISGLQRFSGWTDEEWLKDLRGLNGVKRYKEMRDNDAIVGAFLFAIEMLIRQAPWNTEAASDEEADTHAAQFLKECLFEDMEMTFHELICDALSMLPFGWAYHEIVFKKRMGDTGDPTTQSKFNDGRIGFRKIALRAQETFLEWEFAPNNDLLGMWQNSPPDYKRRFIPFSKSVLFRTRSPKNNPEGRSILRNAWRSYYFKKRMEEIEAIGIERDLAGLPVVKVPPQMLDANASEDEKKALQSYKQLVTSIRRDSNEGVVFPAEDTPEGKKTGYSFELVSSSSRRQFDTSKIIERYDRRIAMTVLADFIFLGQTGDGSMALSVDKTKMFSAAIGSILDTICETLNNKAVPMLFKLNSFTGLTGLPKLVHENIDSIDVGVLGQFLNNFSAAGAPLMGTPEDPNVALVNHVLTKILHLPGMTEEQIKNGLAARKAKQQDSSDPQLQYADDNTKTKNDP